MASTTNPPPEAARAREEAHGGEAARRRGAPRPGGHPLFIVLGVAAILVAWQLLSLVVSPAIMASPVATFRALGRLAWGSTLWIQLLITLYRMVVGLAIGGVVGTVLGLVAPLRPQFRAFLEPLRWAGMSIPVVIVAVLAMLWFGVGDVTVIFVVAFIVLPTMYVNTLEGVLAIDRRLVEMGRVYRFPRRLMLREIYLPGVASPAIAGFTLTTGIAVRAVVLAEVLAAADGVGHAFSRALSFLEAPELFAWVLVLLALMAVIEFGVLRPVRRRALRWRKAAQ
jgi:NitT/TauT family transport system permease protein